MTIQETKLAHDSGPTRATRAVAAAALALSVLGACGDNLGEPYDCTNEPGVICTWAGVGRAEFDGDGNPLLDSAFYWPVDITFASSGTYILDWNNHRVRRVTPEGTLETVIGTDFVGDGPYDLSDLSPPGTPGTNVTLNHPTQLAELPDGNMLLVSWHNHKIRHYDPKTGLVYISCGGPPGYAGDGGPARPARLDQPQALSQTVDGGMYILDQRNQVIRKIDAAGMIWTVAGTPKMPGFSGDGGDPMLAQFNFPTGSNPQPNGTLAVDEDGKLYVADTKNHRIRVIDFEANIIDTLAGTGEAGFSGDGGPAREAQINTPRKLTMGPDGRLYFGDELNHRIRAIDLETGVITTVAGNGETGFSGDGVPPTQASLDRPVGVTFSPAGDMYILDTNNNRIRRVLAN
jgi:DNA-binding beta-propeller fold protein YncE